MKWRAFPILNWTDPAQSRGLTAADAEERLKRDGPNALTPPKKSALQKVGVNMPNSFLPSPHYSHMAHHNYCLWILQPS